MQDENPVAHHLQARLFPVHPPQPMLFALLILSWFPSASLYLLLPLVALGGREGGGEVLGVFQVAERSLQCKTSQLSMRQRFGFPLQLYLPSVDAESSVADHQVHTSGIERVLL